MSKDELISKQQLEIEEYKNLIAENAKTKKELEMRFYAIGAPLNDNKLKFNDAQLKWCLNTVLLVESINSKDHE